uniref:Selenocysteine lyase n=1 Tax=Hirondellea gigas TaxID=1518452 RepID=A0A6A7FYS1_9CRUS
MPAAVVSSIKPNTCLITIMLANNETGIMLPVAQITRLMNEDVRKTREIERLFRILTHTDASQCVGKVAVEVDDLGVDYLTITGHKFYGPRIGALYIRENSQGFLPVYPQFYGGGQERGIRPGTENTPMIAGLGMACELVYSNLYDYASQLKKQRSYLERLLKRHFSEHIKFNCLVPCTEDDPVGCASRHLSGKKETPLVYPRLPNTCSAALCYPQVTAAEILQLCPNLLCSQGAACHSDDNVAYENSILKQHGVCSFHAKRTLRLSIGRETTHQDLESAVLQIKLAVQSLLNKNKAMINNS